jgi:hypothetical protein
MRPYSEAVKADVRRRMSPPQRQSVARIAEELGIHVITLPGVNYVGGLRQLRRRVGAPLPLPWQGEYPGWLSGVVGG